MQINKELHGAQEFAKSLDIKLKVRKVWLFGGFFWVVLGSFNAHQQRTPLVPRNLPNLWIFNLTLIGMSYESKKNAHL